MKKLFTTALLLFAVALVQAAPPQYQVEPEQVQVFVDVPTSGPNPSGYR